MDRDTMLDQAPSLHRELWDWCLNNPGKHKYDWPCWERNGGDIPPVSDYCFACEVAHERREAWVKEGCAPRGMHSICKFCPIGDCNENGVWSDWRGLTTRLDGGILLQHEDMAKLAECATNLRDREWKE